MNSRHAIALLLFLATLSSCKKSETKDPEPGATRSFDALHSDPAAVQLADSVMKAAGGLKAWEELRFVSWLSSDDRMIYWDKQTGRVRMESLSDRTIFLFNVFTRKGRVREKWNDVTSEDTLRLKIQEALAWWNQNSFELFIPFKLKDSGVVLTYLGEDQFADGTKSNVLQLVSQDSVAGTHRYQLHVDLKDNRIKQWSLLKGEKSDSIAFTRTLDQHQRFGTVQISFDGLHGSGPRYIQVDQNIPDTNFDQF